MVYTALIHSVKSMSFDKILLAYDLVFLDFTLLGLFTNYGNQFLNSLVTILLAVLSYIQLGRIRNRNIWGSYRWLKLRVLKSNHT